MLDERADLMVDPCPSLFNRRPLADDGRHVLMHELYPRHVDAIFRSQRNLFAFCGADQWPGQVKVRMRQIAIGSVSARPNPDGLHLAKFTLRGPEFREVRETNGE